MSRAWGVFKVSVLAIALALAPSVWLGWYKYKHSLIHAFDTGIYLQILSNLAIHGSWSSSVTGESFFLGHHFQPALALLVPFYHLSPTPLMLFFISTLSIIVTAFLLLREFRTRLSVVMLGAFLACVCLHPSVASRVSHSFVPEILALPGLVWIAIQLQKDTWKSRNWLSLIGITVFVGCTKETLWIPLAWCMVLLGLRFALHRRIFWSLACLCSLVFLFLFLHWMPVHSIMPKYYGLRYYVPVSQEFPSSFWDWILLLIGNLFSIRSLWTIFNGILLPLAFVPLLGSGLLLLAALPGVLMILAAIHPNIHDPGNQYLLLSLPFLWVAVATGLEKIAHASSSAMLRWLPLFLVLPSLLVFYFPTVAGVVAVVNRNPQTRFFERDIRNIIADFQLFPKTPLILDAELQPLMPEFENVRVLLSFVGNPMQMSWNEYRKASYIISSVDVRDFDCRAVKPDSRESLLYDYKAFYDYCEFIQKCKLAAVIYPDSKLVVYHNHSKVKHDITDCDPNY